MDKELLLIMLMGMREAFDGKADAAMTGRVRRMEKTLDHNLVKDPGGVYLERLFTEALY